jgi:predicted RNase H-like nuclease
VAVLGVDGWRGRWVGALLDGRRVTLLDLADVAAVLAVPDVELVAIDMPIGLSENGVRACDVQARALLRRVGAGSSVFPAPLRRVLAAADYADACRLSIEASGKALSKQAWNLVPAIRALDEALGEPALERVVEVHPELAFRAVADDVRDRKGTARGTLQRLRALRAVMDVEQALDGAPAGVPMIDALDACAAAWSAGRLARGEGEFVGDGATDSHGRPMRICW